MNKKIILKSVLQKRLSIDANLINLHSKQIFSNFLKYQNLLGVSNKHLVAGYYPIKNEVNDLLILDYLKNNGFNTLLPSISKNNKVLSFKKYSNNLINGEFNIKEPSESKSVLPDVIFAPLLAFDKTGNRVGYGGGYYDSTMNYYKSIAHKVIYIGLAYSFQQVEQIDASSFDVKLDAIITEKEYKSFDRA